MGGSSSRANFLIHILFKDRILLVELGAFNPPGLGNCCVNIDRFTRGVVFPHNIRSIIPAIFMHSFESGVQVGIIYHIFAMTLFTKGILARMGLLLILNFVNRANGSKDLNFISHVG